MLNEILNSLEKQFDYKKEVTIKGIKFEISLLTYDEEQKISAIPESEDNPLKYYEKLRCQILSYAIKKINDQVIPDVVEIEKDGKKETKEKSIYLKEILGSIPMKVIEMLFEVYSDFKEEIDSKIESEIKYEWFKDPKIREEERKKKVQEMAAQEENNEKVIDKESDSLNKPIVFREIKEDN